LLADQGQPVPPLQPRNILRNPLLSSTLQTDMGIAFFTKLISALISLGLVIGVIVFFFTLLIGGIQWITSGGDKAAVESARGKITNALIGLVVLFSIFAISKLLETFFGISILTLDIGALRIQ
ncbi:hypothetical protein HY045_01245, partial [Candidatus Woesebacteria bacterium]|nr:hypothetical protein [Candidatus Woesebacteria bacterium]